MKPEAIWTTAVHDHGRWQHQHGKGTVKSNGQPPDHIYRSPEKALMRIENKTYGICRVTGKLIDKARLRAVPHATLSIEAKMGNAR